MTSLLTATGIVQSFANTGSPHRFGRRTPAGTSSTVEVLSGIDLAVGAGESVTVVGPSGVGKSTLLRVLAGLMTPSAGQVQFQGESVTGPPAGIAVVFQDYSRSLFPWLNVQHNVALPLREHGVPRAQRQARTAEALHAVGLDDVERVARAYPWELSGGMQQRVALARAIIARPRLLLLDEPFAAVDAQTRADLQDLVLELRERYGLSLLTVTHDVDEAVYLADRVLVLSPRPAEIIANIAIGLPLPRHQIETRASPEFTQRRIRLQGLLRRETDRLRRR